MTLGIIGKTLAMTLGSTILLGGLTAQNFYKHHNVSFEGISETRFQKADGIFAYTELRVKSDNSVKLFRYSPLFGNSTLYTDQNGDGLVDKFVRYFPNESPEFRTFYRSELPKYAAVFQEGERDFAEQMQRFKPYMHQ